MKFGKVLATQKVPAWNFYYLDYDSLKKDIIRKPATTVEEKQREQNFAANLEKELQKINSFHSLKASELLHALKTIKKIIQEQAEAEDPDILSSAWYDDIKARLDVVTHETIQFDEYKNINIAAFIKLLKKHDKHQKNQLKGFWEIRLNKEGFVKTHTEIIDKVLIKLSKCWFMAHQIHNEEKLAEKGDVKEVKTAQGQVFERSTTKYWVPSDKVLRVKSEVLKHLPISSFNKKSSSLVTSVYYDNEELGLYHERLRREEGSQIIRMRTYNEPPHSTVFVERKVHHESWITEKSVKSRFPIKEKNLMKYLRGELSMTDKLNKMKSNGSISEKEYDATLLLANEIQESVVSKKLQPTMTTRYERTAFQLEGNARVRVSLDTTLDLITEHGYRNNKWGRDLTNEAAIPDSEIHHFPHAVLEIKLSLEMGEEPPQWVKDLLAKDWIITCGKFSKYIHGCAVNLPRKVNLLPAWFPLLEQTSNFRADDRILLKGRDSSIYRTDRDSIMINGNRLPSITAKNSEIRIDVPSSPKLGKSKKSKVELVTMNKEGVPVKSPSKKPKEEEASGWSSKLGGIPIVGKFVKKDKTKKKKVQAPIKIEPKTFFANERTFLQWMSFLVFVQGIGITLIGLSNLPAVRIAGLIFVLIALIFMFYAIIVFLIRRHKISRRERGPYDERAGPVLIVTLLIIGIIVVLVLHFGNFLLICKGYPLLDGNFFRYNPSDLAWDESKGQLVTVGPDMVTYIDTKNRRTYNYPLPGDLEAVTTVPSRSGKLYIGNEYPAYINEWDIESKTVTRKINLNMPNIVADIGLEGLAFVPISGHPHGGVFWAGSQNDGKVYVYDIDLDSTDTTAIDAIESFQPMTGLSAISALNFHEESGNIYGIVDRRWLFAMDPSTKALLGSWAIGVGNPEGVTIRGSGPKYTLYLACDSCYEVWRFDFTWEKGIHSGLCGGTKTEVTIATTGSSTPVATSTTGVASSTTAEESSSFF